MARETPEPTSKALTSKAISPTCYAEFQLHDFYGFDTISKGALKLRVTREGSFIALKNTENSGLWNVLFS